MIPDNSAEMHKGSGKRECVWRACAPAGRLCARRGRGCAGERLTFPDKGTEMQALGKPKEGARMQEKGDRVPQEGDCVPKVVEAMQEEESVCWEHLLEQGVRVSNRAGLMWRRALHMQ